MEEFLKSKRLSTDRPVPQKTASTAVEVYSPADLARIRDESPTIMDIMPYELLFADISPKSRMLAFTVFNSLRPTTRITLLGLTSLDTKPTDRSVNCYVDGMWPMIHNNKEESIKMGMRVFWRPPRDGENCAVQQRPPNRQSAVLTHHAPDEWAAPELEWALMQIGSSGAHYTNADAMQRFRLNVLLENHFLLGVAYRSARFGEFFSLRRV